MGGNEGKNLGDNIPGSEGLSSLYEHGKKEEPSAAIDRYILQAARDAVSEKKGAGSGPFSGSWQIPAALAAVLILAVGVTMTMENFSGPGRSQVERFEPTSDMSAPAERPADRKKTTKPGSRIETKAKRHQVQTEESPAPADVRKAAPASPPVDSAEKNEKAGLLRTVPSAEPGAPIERETSQETMDIGEQAGVASKPLQPEAQPTAERWLDSIRELVEQDKLDEARKQLADFRRVYPDYTLPEELKSLER